MEDGLLPGEPGHPGRTVLLASHGDACARGWELSVFTAEELRQLINVARADFPLEIYVLRHQTLALLDRPSPWARAGAYQVAILVIEVHRPTADRHLAAE